MTKLEIVKQANEQRKRHRFSWLEMILNALRHFTIYLAYSKPKKDDS
jgi:hypothetical protein